MDNGSPTGFESPWLSGLAQRWHRRRTYGARALPGVKELTARKLASGERVSVVLPALNEADTIGVICGTIRDRLMGPGALVDELLVVDCASTDGTPELAATNGATVHQVADLVPEMQAVAGKGEALWRSLSVVSGEIVVWIDSDIRNFSPRFVVRLVAPLLTDPTISYVKGFYRRPIARGEELTPDEGGRVTELLARPLLSALFPELCGFTQPLAGEYAGTVDVLRRVPFFTGYSVEVGLLIDLLHEVGLDALAQVDLGTRQNRHQPLRDLSAMAYAVLVAAESRLGDRVGGWGQMMLPIEEGLARRAVAIGERPPVATLEQPAV